MKFKLEIDVENDVFADCEMCPEIGRILLRLVKEQFGAGSIAFSSPLKLRDINGNTVGSAEFVED
jgi:hypothetical protein